MRGARMDINGDDPDRRAPILNQGSFPDANHRPTIGGNGEAFHAFVGYAPGRVAATLGVPNGTEMSDGELRGQHQDVKTFTGGAVELIDVGTIFVGDEHAL